MEETLATQKENTRSDSLERKLKKHLYTKLVIITVILTHNPNKRRGCPGGVMVKEMDYRIVVSEFVFQSCYYVHFRANTLGKGMNPLILPSMG